MNTIWKADEKIKVNCSLTFSVKASPKTKIVDLLQGIQVPGRVLSVIADKCLVSDESMTLSEAAITQSSHIEFETEF
jgi:hypothetical protein